MSEALEYRMVRNKALIFTLLGAVALVGAVAALVGAHATTGTTSVVFDVSVLAFLGLELLAVSQSFAMGTQGYCRKAHERIFGEYSDPPLDEWESDLEERGEFATSEPTEKAVIADD